MAPTTSLLALYSLLLLTAPPALAQSATATNVVYAHGILASLAWVIFFPLGAILLRTLSGPRVIWIHAGVQAFSTIMLLAAAIMGIWLAANTDTMTSYHPVLGLVTLALVITQPFTGLIHHSLFKRRGGGGGRTLFSYVHMWLGRSLITIGMINGGLGLLLAGDATTDERIAYGVVAGGVWVVYVGVVVRFEGRRGGGKEEGWRLKEVGGEGDGEGGSSVDLA